MTAINRRTALTVVASAPLAAAPALASAGEDAELIQLWEELKAENAEYQRTQAAFTAAEEATIVGHGKRWQFVSVEDDPSRAVFVCAREGLLKVVPLRGKNGLSLREQARKIETRLTAEFEQSWAEAKRRCKVDAAERAMHRSLDRRQHIIERIAETPAEGAIGVCIKLAVLQYERDWMQEPAITLAGTAYETVARLVGVDCAAQIVSV